MGPSDGSDVVKRTAELSVKPTSPLFDFDI